MAQELFHAKQQSDDTAAKNTEHAKSAEEVQRPGKIAQQKANRQKIEEHAEGAGDAIMRYSALAVHISDGNFANRRPVPRSQRRNKPVQLAIQRDLFENVAPVGF